MYFRDGIERRTRASTLVRQLVDGYDPKYGIGSGTCSVYDTAWVSMVIKKIDGQTQWLFPSSFQYLLDHQNHDGGWQHGPSDIDGILHSLAALMSICRHIARPCQMKENLEDLKHRKFRTIYFLETKFATFDSGPRMADSQVQSCTSKLLKMLHDEGVEFSFRGNDPSLQESASRPTVNGDPRTVVQSSSKSQIGGEIDRGRRRDVYGSISASPASTAAYLVDCPSWDDEAEAYLRHIISVGDDRNAGGVPAKFPTTVFEIASSITTLVQNGFAIRDLDASAVGNAAEILEECIRLDSGVTGFAPYAESDAINTAKTISALSILGRSVSPQGLIVRFESHDYFKTWTQDCSPRFVTNCYVLKALLDSLPGDGDQMPQIEKTVRFLCSCWWTVNGWIEDRSNISAFYPIMLMTEAFVRLLEVWQRGYVPCPMDPVVKDKVYISLFQALTRVLQTQKADGSWEDGGCEATAYAVITLSRLMSLTSTSKLKLQVAQAIEGGRKVLVEKSLAFSEPDRIWKGTTASGNSAIHQAYILAALQSPSSKQGTGLTIEDHFGIPLARMMIQAKYYSRQAWLVNMPEWLVQASLIESYLFLPQLRRLRYTVFPSERLADDRYFESIPYAWIVASHLDNRFIGAEFLYQMMILSVLARQLEYYMDHVVAKSFAGCLFEVEDIIYRIFQELELEDKDRCFCDNDSSDTFNAPTDQATPDVRSVLYGFTSHILNHPYILMASLGDQSQLRSELLCFLLSRVTRLPYEGNANSATDQTAHSYHYAFLACLVGNQSLDRGLGLRGDFLDTAEQQYLAADLCRHMSIMGFMSTSAEEQQSAGTQPLSCSSRSTSFGNDSGRDRFTRSVSSASTTSSAYESNSPVSPISSMSSSLSDPPSRTVFSQPSKRQLSQAPIHPSLESLQVTRLLSYERRCLNLCLEGLLEAGINQRTNNVLRFFVDATELSEQIFRDPNIGTTCQNTPTPEILNEPCMLQPPPVPPKRRRGSVAAARAALVNKPLAPKQEIQPEFKESKHQDSHNINPVLPPIEQFTSPDQVERNWNWDKKPSSPTKRSSHATSEVKRIENIMSEIDGIKLEMAPKPESNASSQRRAASETDAIWAHPHITKNTQRRFTNSPVVDAEAIKLAKVRLETQRKLKLEAEKKTATNKAAAQRKLANNSQTKLMEDIMERDAMRRAACPSVDALPVGLGSLEAQAKRLHRASKLGGPKWKAPF